MHASFGPFPRCSESTDFHLHRRKDKEFKYSEEEARFAISYTEGLKQACIRVGVIANHNKFDLEEFKILQKQARKEEILLLPGLELSVKDGSNGYTLWWPSVMDGYAIKRTKTGRVSFNYLSTVLSEMHCHQQRIRIATGRDAVCRTLN